MIYNFGRKYSGLAKWQPVRNKSTIKNANKYDSYLRLKKYLPTIEDIIKNKKLLYYPSSLVILFTLLINFIGIFPGMNIWRLESAHLEYTEKISEFKSTRDLINNEVDKLVEIAKLYDISAPVFLFAYFIQKSIPSNIQLSEYTIDKNGFKMIATGESLKAVNKMIALLLECPFIDTGSVVVKRVMSTGAMGDRQGTYTPVSMGALIEISGRIKLLPLENRLSLNRQSYNHGYVKKLERYINLVDLIDS